MGITFDPSNSYINITSPTVSTTALALYNASMDWTDQLENTSYTVPMAADGKFPMGGGVNSDSIFRLINGWKLFPWVAGQMIRVTGTIITDDETVRWIYPGGNVGMEFQVSSQATVVETGISGVTEGDLNDMADKVWDEAIADHQIVGSTGEALGDAGASAATPEEIADAVLDEAVADHQGVGSLGEAIKEIHQVSIGRWKFDDTFKTMTIYDIDNSSPLVVFDMKDINGSPTLTSIYERVRQ